MQNGTGDGLRGLTARLFVLFLAMVVAGFVIPSPGVSAPRPFTDLVKTEQRPSLYRAMDRPAKPVELIVRSLGVRAPVHPIELEGTVLTPPSDASTVGWWADSARPGAKKGNTVITGHTVHTGGGELNPLGRTRRGALIKVRTPAGTLHYEATRTFVYSKAELAENALSLFRQDRPSNRLVLITCTDWNGSDYDSNIIVFAQPLGIRKPPRKQTGNDRIS